MFRGAKTAMTLALKAPDLISNVVSVDNAPLDAALLSNFGKYIQGMKKIEYAGVTRQAKADKILQDYEEASITISGIPVHANTLLCSLCPSASFF
jgi:hypothetical protein